MGCSGTGLKYFSCPGESCLQPQPCRCPAVDLIESDKELPRQIFLVGQPFRRIRHDELQMYLNMTVYWTEQWNKDTGTQVIQISKA